MVQHKDHITLAQTVILQCLYLTLLFYNLVFNKDSGKVWTNDTDTLEEFIEYLSQIDSTSKFKFTMQVKDDRGLQFLDLKGKFENFLLSQ